MFKDPSTFKGPDHMASTVLSAKDMMMNPLVLKSLYDCIRVKCIEII